MKNRNQKIKRKDTKITALKEKLDTSVNAQNLSDIMKALSGLRNKYRRLKRQYKKKTHAQGESSSEVRIQELETKLELKEEEIIHLQNKKLMLEEKIKELEAEQKETKLDKKSIPQICV